MILSGFVVPPLISLCTLLLLVHDFVKKLNGLLCASIREHFLYAVPSPYAFLGMSEIIRPESRPILLGV